MTMDSWKRIAICVAITAAIFWPALSMPDLAGFLKDEGPVPFILLGMVVACDWYLILTPRKKHGVI